MNTAGDERLRRLVLFVMMALFALTILINLHNNPLDGDDVQIDEQAHLSYALTLIDQHRFWPDFDHFTMADRTTAQPLRTTNYLNHPPTFYWLAKLAHDVVPTLTLQDYRNGATALSLLAIALYGFIGARLAMPLVATVLYAVMPWLIYMHRQVGFYNNDCLAILGGLLVTHASLLWFEQRRTALAFRLALIGLALASVKLTALILVGLYAASCLLLQRPALRSMPWQAWLAALLVGALILLPYAHLILETGSPAPETLGQRLMMTNHPPGDNWSRTLITGWVQEPRMHFLPWLMHFFHDFAVQVRINDTTFLPLLLIMVAMLRGLLLPQPPTPITCMLRAGFIATSITLLIHIWFAWGRYLHYGWRLDSGLRYYYPLLAVYGAACGTALNSVSRAKRDTV